MKPSGYVDAVHYAGRHCLVTGGLGFIGSNLVIALVNSGATVTVIDSMVPSHGGALHNLPNDVVDAVKVHVAPIDDESVGGHLATSEFIFNVAGQVSHVDSMDDPLNDLYLNGQSQLAFLELVRKFQPAAKVVYTSTRQVYGRALTPRIAEDHPTRPLDINGISKLAADHAHRVYASAFGLDTAILRLTNTYGPRLRLSTDRQGFLAVFIRRALLGQTIQLFGDGEQRRDCLFIDDVVEALLRTGAMPTTPGVVMNLGHDQSASLREIAECLVTISGRGNIALTPWPEDRERIDVGSVALSSDLAHTTLGWRPTIGLEVGLKQTLEFFESHADTYL